MWDCQKRASSRPQDAAALSRSVFFKPPALPRANWCFMVRLPAYHSITRHPILPARCWQHPGLDLDQSWHFAIACGNPLPMFTRFIACVVVAASLQLPAAESTGPTNSTALQIAAFDIDATPPIGSMMAYDP